MSAEASGWVFRHSPYTGAQFAVHVAIADSVNDQNGNEFWMSQPKLATKSRTTRPTVKAAVDRMVADGMLTELGRSPTPGGGQPTRRFRFEMPDAQVVYEARFVPDDKAKPLSLAVGDKGNQVCLAKQSQPRDKGKPVTPNPIEPKGEPKEPAPDGAPSLELHDQPRPNDYGWDKFWAAYPKRDGRRGNKAKALSVWKKMPYETKLRAWHQLKVYNRACAAGRPPKDAERWLADGQANNWTDYWETWAPDLPAQRPGNGPPDPYDDIEATRQAALAQRRAYGDGS